MQHAQAYYQRRIFFLNFKLGQIFWKKWHFLPKNLKKKDQNYAILVENWLFLQNLGLI